MTLALGLGFLAHLAAFLFVGFWWRRANYRWAELIAKARVAPALEPARIQSRKRANPVEFIMAVPQLTRESLRQLMTRQPDATLELWRIRTARRAVILLALIPGGLIFPVEFWLLERLAAAATDRIGAIGYVAIAVNLGIGLWVLVQTGGVVRVYGDADVPSPRKVWVSLAGLGGLLAALGLQILIWRG